MTGEAPTQELHAKKPKSGWLNLLVDYGPLLVFFLTYKYYSPDTDDNALDELTIAVLTTGAVVRSTLAFIVAALLALAISKWRIGKISPMLWLSTAMIVVFGGITIWTGDQRVIQAKPTIIYLVFGLMLLVGWWKKRALLQVLLEAAFDGLNEEGWLKLSRNWGIFFFFLAALNEALVWYLSFGDWLAAKLWVFMPLSFLFTFTQLPMLLRHGLAVEEKAEVIENPPNE